ncbi:MAG: hypothetical protein ACRCWQ_02590 [Bacilli bacterium]
MNYEQLFTDYREAVTDAADKIKAAVNAVNAIHPIAIKFDEEAILAVRDEVATDVDFLTALSVVEDFMRPFTEGE